MKKVKYAKVLRLSNLRGDGTAPIYIRAYLNGKNKFFPTKLYVTPKQWDKKNLRVLNHPLQVRYNQLIRDLESKIENFELRVLQKDGKISLEKLADWNRDTIDISFTDFFKQQLKNPKLSHDSFTDQNQTLQKLASFKKLIHFNEISYRLISGFDAHLFGLGLHTNTVGKHHKNLKKYINLAIQFNFIQANENPYLRFVVKRQPTERVFLLQSELDLVESTEIKAENDLLVRDFFLFCCWTGCRFQDASKIVGTSFLDTSEGLILDYIATKTKKPQRLNLRKLFNGKPERLIKKYLDKFDDFYFDDPDNPMPIFFNLTNQHINRRIKIVVQNLDVRVGVKENITCHVARHTFATLMANKVRPHVLQRLLQHSKIKETMIYVHLSNEMVDDALDNVKW